MAADYEMHGEGELMVGVWLDEEAGGRRDEDKVFI